MGVTSSVPLSWLPNPSTSSYFCALFSKPISFGSFPHFTFVLGIALGMLD
jgi:hypothetical protein